MFHTQASEDVEKGVEGAGLIPEDDGRNKKAVIEAVVQWTHAAIAKDRKVTALKNLQVSYATGEVNKTSADIKIR